MDTLPVPEPWERTAAPGAVRTRDRRAAETTVEDEPLLVGAVAAALDRPDAPVHIALAPERADLWQAVQLRFLWGMHRVLHDVLTPPRAIPAAGWSWSFSTYEPVLGTADGQHLAFGPPVADGAGPFLEPPAPDYRRVAEGLVSVLREEGGDALARHLAERGVPEAPTFADRRALLRDWLDPRPRAFDDVPVPERLPDEDAPSDGALLPDLPEVEEPGEEETGPQPPPEPRVPAGRPGLEADGAPGGAVSGVPGGQRSLKGVTEEGVESSAGPGDSGGPWRRPGGSDPAERGGDRMPGGGRAHRGSGTHGNGEADGGNEALWPEPLPELPPEEPGAGGSGEAPRRPEPRIAPARGQAPPAPERPSAGSGIFGAPEPRRRPRLVPDTGGERESAPGSGHRERTSAAEASAGSGSLSTGAAAPREPGAEPSGEDVPGSLPNGRETFRFLGRARRVLPEPDGPAIQGGAPRDAHASATPDGGVESGSGAGSPDGAPSDETAPRGAPPREGAVQASPAPAQDTFGTGGAASLTGEPAPPPESLVHQQPHDTEGGWTIAASPVDRGPSPDRRSADPEPAPGPGLTDGPEDRVPADAPPLPVVPDTEESPLRAPLDYAAETEPDPEQFSDDGPPEDNWPTQYVDLPLGRLERWHSRHGPEGARIDVVDARAAVRAERSELQRVREERDHYHAEVQELRREVARLDRPWLDREDEEEDVPQTPRSRRWPSRALVLVLLAALLATGLEAGARFGWGVTDLLATLLGRVP
jgi:hypothetical protein